MKKNGGKNTKRINEIVRVVNANADALANVQRHSNRTSSRLGFWICVGCVFGYFVESQITNLDRRLGKLEKKEEEQVVDCEEWTDKEE